MPFAKSSTRALLVLTLLGAGLVVGGVALRVYDVTAPTRGTIPTGTLDTLMLHAESVEFPATDGVNLSGWLLAGESGVPPVILCHARGGDRTHLINLGGTLNAVGFPVLLFDFRGHGQSGGRRSTLGLREKRDVLGAAEYLERRGIARHRLGVYGVGMGAHAAVLAAADQPDLDVLVLDGLYPDPGYPLVLETYRGWEFGVKHLGFLPRGIFTIVNGARIDRNRAADVLPSLQGRDLLLLAPAGDSRLATAMQAMYESIPVQPDGEGNLAVIPASQSDGLYGDQFSRYQDRVKEFFTTRLMQR